MPREAADPQDRPGGQVEPHGQVEPVPPSVFPAYAARADDLDTIRKSVEDAAVVSGALWVSYLFVMFYLAVAAGAVTHVDLFLESAVKLPFLSIELPIKAFFLLAPLILCITHVYTLTSFVLLSEKAQAYHHELKRQIAGDGNPSSAASREAKEIRDRIRRQLPNNIFVQFLAGPEDVRSGALGLILKTIAWTTLAIAPVMILLLMQLQFLPYHSCLVTWTTRLALLFDLVAVWWLWQAILLGRGEHRRPEGRWSVAAMGLLGGLSVAAALFSWTIATFPGEWMDNKLFAIQVFPSVDSQKNRISVSLHDYLLNRPIDSITRRRGLPLSSTLILPVFDIFEQLKIDESKKLGPFRYVFHVRGRDFRGADFELSNLSNVDFEGSLLEGASFDRATLHNTSLFCAHLEGAILTNTDLQGAWFHGTDLTGANLDEAKGQGAMFDGAQLTGARLADGTFTAASFENADLTASIFDGAHLEAASFENRSDIAADCITAERAERGTRLANTVFNRASLVGASFAGGRFSGVKHEDAVLDGSDFAEVQDGQGKKTMTTEAQAALAQTFRRFLCSGDPNAIFVLRGLLATERLAAGGPEILPLLDAIEKGEPNCRLDAMGLFDKINVIKLRETIRAASPHNG